MSVRSASAVSGDPRHARRSGRVAMGLLGLVGAVPVLLVLVAEGAWVFVIYALFQAASRDPEALFPVAFVAAAVCGAAAGRIGPRRVGGAWPAVAVILVALVAAVGWLTSAGTVRSVASGALADAVVAHPGGWLVGLAFLRGIAASRKRSDDAPAGPLIVIAIPAIVGAYVVAGALPTAAATAFRAAALPATVAFVGAGLVGLALSRVARLEKTSAIDWRRNPAWLGLLVTVVGAVLVLAVPAAFTIGPLVVLVLAALPVPLLFLGFLSGFDRRALRTLVATIGTVAFVVLILRVFASGPAQQNQQSPQAAVGQPPASDQAWVTVAGWILLVIAVAIVVAILAAIWMRGARGQLDEDVAEERAIDRGTDIERPTWRAPWRRARRRPPPTDAVTAYLAAVALIERDPELGRLAAETPAEHAGRVRRVASGPDRPESDRGIPGPLARLAADYELARFADRALTTAEERRALARWDTVRRVASSRRPRRPEHSPARPGAPP